MRLGRGAALLVVLLAGVLWAEPEGPAEDEAPGSAEGRGREAVAGRSPEELLRAMVERAGQLRYEGVRRSLGGWPGRSVRVRLYRDGPERLRVEVLGDEDRPVRIMVRVGERLHFWSAREPGRWRERPAGGRPRGPWRHLDLLLRNYRVEFVGQEAFLGRPAAVLRLRSEHPDRPQARLWVDLETSLNLKLEKVNPGGERTLGFEFLSLSFPQEMDPATFSVPTGGEEGAEEEGTGRRSGRARRRRFADLAELAQAAEGPLVVPLAVPAGFVETGFSLLPRMGLARIGYSDGLSEISLYQSPPRTPGDRFRGAEGSAASAGPGQGPRRGAGRHPRRPQPEAFEEVEWRGVRLRVARSGGMTFVRRTLTVGEPPVEVRTTVVGEIGEEELKEMSASLGEYRVPAAGPGVSGERRPE